jgi:hypothetical protein
MAKEDFGTRIVGCREDAGSPSDFQLVFGESPVGGFLVGRDERFRTWQRSQGRSVSAREGSTGRTHQSRFRESGKAVPVVNRVDHATVPTQVLGLPVGVSDDRRKA